MAATLFYRNDSRNQFTMSYADLEDYARRALTFTKTHATEAERQYQVVMPRGITHTIIVSAWDTNALETITYGRHMHKVDKAFSA